MAHLEIQCSTHRTYRGLKKPRAGCKFCWYIYRRVNFYHCKSHTWNPLELIPCGYEDEDHKWRGKENMSLDDEGKFKYTFTHWEMY